GEIHLRRADHSVGKEVEPEIGIRSCGGRVVEVDFKAHNLLVHAPSGVRGGEGGEVGGDPVGAAAVIGKRTDPETGIPSVQHAVVVGEGREPNAPSAAGSVGHNP